MRIFTYTQPLTIFIINTMILLIIPPVTNPQYCVNQLQVPAFSSAVEMKIRRQQSSGVKSCLRKLLEKVATVLQQAHVVTVRWFLMWASPSTSQALAGYS